MVWLTLWLTNIVIIQLNISKMGIIDVYKVGVGLVWAQWLLVYFDICSCGLVSEFAFGVLHDFVLTWDLRFWFDGMVDGVDWVLWVEGKGVDGFVLLGRVANVVGPIANGCGLGSCWPHLNICSVVQQLVFSMNVLNQLAFCVSIQRCLWWQILAGLVRTLALDASRANWRIKLFVQNCLHHWRLDHKIIKIITFLKISDFWWY